MSELKPVGTAKWRRKNRAFRSDAVSLLGQLALTGLRPAVIYADPPYTKDQYSRYYHLWETLVIYDYPEVTGKAVYRSDRFGSDFSYRSKVKGAFEELIGGAAAVGSSLVLSYPSNGLLDDSEGDIRNIFKNYYGDVVEVIRVNHQHSTLGASKGHERTPVTELIFVARG